VENEGWGACLKNLGLEQVYPLSKNIFRGERFWKPFFVLFCAIKITKLQKITVSKWF
jgi:hypothetical protein